MDINKKLGIAAVALLVLSVLSYNRSISRAERFERGQKFLSQLNADNVHEIEINKGEERALLRKTDEQFVVASMHNYPAKNETINRFINVTISIALEKSVGNGEGIEKELEIQAGEKTTKIVLRNDAGKEMVTFIVGKSSDDGRGNYVKRVNDDDDDVYLTSKGVHLSSDHNTFLDKDILDVKEDQIKAIQGSGFSIKEKDGALALSDVPKGKQESSDVSQVKGMLGGLRFDKVYLADDSELDGLNFNKHVLVDLKDSSSYEVKLAVKEDKYYMRIQGNFDRKVLEDSSKIAEDDDEAVLKTKSEALSRRDAIEEFNNFHGSWVYLLSEFQGKKFIKTRSDLIEDQKKDEG